MHVETDLLARSRMMMMIIINNNKLKKYCNYQNVLFAKTTV